jgi:hypothetical protein
VTREQANKAIVDAATLLRGRDLFVVGSQALYGLIDEDITELIVVRSNELDLLLSESGTAETRERLWLFIHENLGEDSEYHLAHDVFVDAMKGSGTVPRLAAGWRDRLVERHYKWRDSESGDDRDARVFFLELYDLLASKLSAGRDKDFAFVAMVIHRGWAEVPLLADRLNELDLSSAEAEQRLHRLNAELGFDEPRLA